MVFISLIIISKITYKKGTNDFKISRTNNVMITEVMDVSL